MAWRIGHDGAQRRRVGLPAPADAAGVGVIGIHQDADAVGGRGGGGSAFGAHYPHAEVDKAWLQLVYGAHHDAITGSESDQVYLDLLTGWREAYDLAAEVLDRSLEHLTTGLGGVWGPAGRSRCSTRRRGPEPIWSG